jgi:hypothetical protein
MARWQAPIRSHALCHLTERHISPPHPLRLPALTSIGSCSPTPYTVSHRPISLTPQSIDPHPFPPHSIHRQATTGASLPVSQSKSRSRSRSSEGGSGPHTPPSSSPTASSASPPPPWAHDEDQRRQPGGEGGKWPGPYGWVTNTIAAAGDCERHHGLCLWAGRQR